MGDWDGYKSQQLSHWHYDRSRQKSGAQPHLNASSYMSRSLEPPPTVQVMITGGTIVYCGPETWPSAGELQWVVVLGIHPRISTIS